MFVEPCSWCGRRVWPWQGLWVRGLSEVVEHPHCNVVRALYAGLEAMLDIDGIEGAPGYPRARAALELTRGYYKAGGK